MLTVLNWILIILAVGNLVVAALNVHLGIKNRNNPYADPGMSYFSAFMSVLAAAFCITVACHNVKVQREKAEAQQVEATAVPQSYNQ